MSGFFKKVTKKTSLLLLGFTLFNLIYLSNLSADTLIHPDDTIHLIQRVHADEDIVQPDDPAKVSPNPNYLLKQWNLNLMNIGEAWADGYTGRGVKIAILDTGFYHRHPDISMAGGYSVFPDDPWSYDHSGHGTHIAGILSAKRNTDYQGIAPDAEVYGIKIYPSDDINEYDEVSTDVNSVIKGIRQAIRMNVDILVISSGLSYHDDDLYKIIQEAHARGILILAASGNGNLAVNYPAHYNEVIAITAVDEELKPALDIIYGKENEFSAPGVNIGGLSIPESTYSYPYIFMSGSSQATPHAAGIAAIYMQKYGVRGEEVREIMREQAINIGDPGLFGYGLLYYRSNETSKNSLVNKNDEEESAGNREQNQAIEAEESGVRKPFSSREANQDLDNEELLTFRQAVVTIDDEGIGKIRGNIFSLIEAGGTLEFVMGDSTSLRLTKEQISEIRQNNLTIMLAKEGMNWKISPANFIPGQAVLRFYAGKPVGIIDNPNVIEKIATISIFQEGTRQGLYPGQMEVLFEIDNPELLEPTELRSAYFNKENSEWFSLEKEIDSDASTITLLTRYTGTLGLFDADQIIEANVLEEENEQPNLSNFILAGIFIVVLLLTFVTSLLFKKRKL